MRGVAELDRADSPFVRGEAGGFWNRYRDLGALRQYAAGALIYQQGEHSDCFYYLISGRVKVYVSRPDGSEQVMAFMEPGTAFGESACFDGLPYYASAAALRPSTVCIFTRDAVLAAAARDPAILAELFKGVVRKQRLLATQVESLSFLKAPSRVALMLARLAADYGLPLPDGRGKRLGLRLTHEEIASMLGTSRVTVSREISALIKEGILGKDKWNIVVLDEERLWQRALPGE